MMVHFLVVLSVIGPSSEHSFFLNFAMNSSSGAAQASKTIGLIVEYLKKPEDCNASDFDRVCRRSAGSRTAMWLRPPFSVLRGRAF